MLATTLDRDSATTLAALRETLERADATLEAAHALVDPRGHNAIQLQRTLDDFAATSARLRNLAERVDRDPSVRCAEIVHDARLVAADFPGARAHGALPRPWRSSRCRLRLWQRCATAVRARASSCARWTFRISRQLSGSGRPRRQRARLVEEHRMGGAPVGGRRAGAARRAVAAARRFARPGRWRAAASKSISRSSSLRLIRKEPRCILMRDGFFPALPRAAAEPAAASSTCLWRARRQRQSPPQRPPRSRASPTCCRRNADRMPPWQPRGRPRKV